MTKELIAAIDQGTTSTRCILFDREGNAVSSAQNEHAQLTPRPGWLEHDPAEIWEKTQKTVASALEGAGAAGARIVAVGISNQRETSVLWDRKTGRPLHNAIVWQDARTGDICRKLSDSGAGERIGKISGLPVSTYFSGPKISWLLEFVPGARKAAERGEALFGTIDSWLVWNLTGGANGGVHITDVTNASRTMLMDLEKLAWSEEMLDLLDIPAAILPEIRPSSDPALYGATCGGGPFADGTPVSAALGDQQAALAGQACFSPGEAKNTYGTGCFLLMNVGKTPKRSSNGLLSTVAYKFGDDPAIYALEGSVAVAGSAVQWLRDQLRIIESASEVEALASKASDNGGVYFVPAFSGLFAPHWDGGARGTITGLTRFAGREHIARAALEAVAFQTRDVTDAMEADSGIRLGTLKVDGGMVENSLLMQLQSDLLGVEVIRPQNPESTALGAAFAAGLAVGFWKDTDEIASLWKRGRSWTPSENSSRMLENYGWWGKAVEKSKGWM